MVFAPTFPAARRLLVSSLHEKPKCALCIYSDNAAGVKVKVYDALILFSCSSFLSCSLSLRAGRPRRYSSVFLVEILFSPTSERVSKATLLQHSLPFRAKSLFQSSTIDRVPGRSLIAIVKLALFVSFDPSIMAGGKFQSTDVVTATWALRQPLRRAIPSPSSSLQRIAECVSVTRSPPHTSCASGKSCLASTRVSISLSRPNTEV